MGQAIGTVLPLAVAIAIFPVPVIASVLLLAGRGGRARGVAFVASWYAGLVASGGIVLAFAGAVDASDDGDPATWASVLLLVLGVVAFALGVRQWGSRPREGDEAATPGWMRSLDEFTAVRAAGAGLALTVLNPKNVLLVAAAAVEIAEHELAAGTEIVALLVFSLLASLGVLAPLAVSIAMPKRSQELLDGVRTWLTRNSAVIMTVLLVLIGVKLVGDAIAGFSS